MKKCVLAAKDILDILTYKTQKPTTPTTPNPLIYGSLWIIMYLVENLIVALLLSTREYGVGDF